MDIIVSVLIFIEFLTISLMAYGYYQFQKLYDEAVKISKTPPLIDLNPVYNEIKYLRLELDRGREHRGEQDKIIDTLKSAMVLKSAFK
jgi:hypothetical protein